MKTKKIILVTIISFVIAGFAVAWYMYNKGPVNIQNEIGIAVTAEDLYATFAQDSISAQKLYNNKIVVVTGNIEKIQTNNEKQQVILLHTNENGAYVNCTMDEPTNQKSGTIIAIKGICGGIGQGDVDLGLKGDVYITRGIISQQ